LGLVEFIDQVTTYNKTIYKTIATPIFTFGTALLA